MRTAEVLLDEWLEDREDADAAPIRT